MSFFHVLKVKRPIYVALLHYPISNRNGQVVTTAVTNMDIHDISRTARTYGIKRYFLITPIELQHDLVNRILRHWDSETSRQYHPDRVEAVSRVALARSFQEVKDAIKNEVGEFPEVVLTDARELSNSVSYEQYRLELWNSKDSSPPVLICFGTGWGISEVFYPEVDRVLEPIRGREVEGESVYNHLSVRAAAAIILDRLFAPDRD